MSNTFDLTIKHNLEVGLTNAINQINHLNTFVLASMNFEESALTQCSSVVVEQLKNSLEMLSLIEPEGEEWISVDERLPEPNEDILFWGMDDYSGHMDEDGRWFKGNRQCFDVAYWMPKPVTLSEASNHSFQQAVEMDTELDVQGITSKK